MQKTCYGEVIFDCIRNWHDLFVFSARLLSNQDSLTADDAMHHKSNNNIIVIRLHYGGNIIFPHFKRIFVWIFPLHSVVQRYGSGCGEPGLRKAFRIVFSSVSLKYANGGFSNVIERKTLKSPLFIIAKWCI